MAGALTKVFAYRSKETRPLHLDIGDVAGIAEATREGLKLGMPSIGADQLANKILLEGREDAGANEYNIDNPRANKLYNALVDKGIDPRYAKYPAAVLDKSEVAKRLNIPFELAWNGTGKTAQGADGQRHTARAAASTGAASDPKNADFVDLINRGLTDRITPQEKLMQMGNLEIVNAILGPDSMRDTGDGAYKVSDKAAHDLELRIETTMQVLGYTPEQKAAVRDATDSKYGPWSAVGALPDLYKQASGIATDKYRRDVTADKISKSPAAKEVMNVVLGVDPDGTLYKDAYARLNPEPPGILDNVSNFFSNLIK